MKAILISIQPKWCELIASGKKTIEVRKTRPKIETPFKCYIYCSKGKTFLYKNPNNGELFLDSNGGYRGGDYEDRFLTGKVIGEFVCDRIIRCQAYCQAYYDDSGKKHLTNLFDVDISKICLSESEIFDYIIGKDKKDDMGWLWHISDLKIYDKAKELSDFSKYEYKYLGGCCVNNNCKNYIYNGYYQPPECKIDGCFFKRPPQSWCYVEELL